MPSSNLSLETAAWCERIEARAWTDIVVALAGQDHNRLGAATSQVGSVQMTTVAAFDFQPFNRAIGLGVDRPASPVEIDEAVAFYARAGVAHFGVSLSPMAQPPDIVGWLDARGLSASSTSAKLWRDAELGSASSSRIRVSIIGPDQAQAWANVQRAAWGMPKLMAPWFTCTVARPGWRHYLGYDGDDPVTAAALFVSGRVGWLGFAATIPSHQGRGGHGATLRRRLADAHELGCSLLVAETTERPDEPNPSRQNLVREGFKLAYMRPEYSPGPNLDSVVE